MESNGFSQINENHQGFLLQLIEFMISLLIVFKQSTKYIFTRSEAKRFTDKMLFMFLRNTENPVLQYLLKYLRDYTQPR